MSFDLQNGFAMLLWFSEDEEDDAPCITKGASSSATRSFKGLGQKRPHEEVEGLSDAVTRSVDKFEEFLARAQFALTSKESEDSEDNDKVVVNLTAHEQASSLTPACLPNVTLRVLLSGITFKLACPEDIDKLHTRKAWLLELRGVREDARWKYGRHFQSNIVVVLYEQLPALTQKWLDANDNRSHPKKWAWSLDPGDDTFGIPTAKSLKEDSFCDYAARDCMRLVSMRLNKTTPEGHSAHGLAAATENIGPIPMSKYRNQVRFPEPGHVYVVGFELPPSAQVKRALAKEQDCPICSETYTTGEDGGVLVAGCGHYVCGACCSNEAYSKDIKGFRHCPMCRGPCALAPEAPPEAPPAAGYYSSYGVVGERFRPYPVVALAEPPALEYHPSLKQLLLLNGFVIPDMFTRVLGIEKTEHLQYFTADDISEKFSGVIVDRFLRLHYQVIEHYRDQYRRQQAEPAQARPTPPFSYHKVLRDLLDVNGSREYTEVILLALDIGWTDQLRSLTADEIKACITLPEILGNLLRLHKLVLDFSPEVSEDEDAEAGMDFP
jgi:hypothetical protein